MANLAVAKTSHQMKALVKQQQRIRGQYPIDQEGDRRLISTVYVPYEKLTAYEQENYVAWREESLDDVCFTHNRYLNVYHEDDVVQITEETKEVYRASWNNFFCAKEFMGTKLKNKLSKAPNFLDKWLSMGDVGLLIREKMIEGSEGR